MDSGTAAGIACGVIAFVIFPLVLLSCCCRQPAAGCGDGCCGGRAGAPLDEGYAHGLARGLVRSLRRLPSLVNPMRLLGDMQQRPLQRRSSAALAAVGKVEAAAGNDAQLAAAGLAGPVQGGPRRGDSSIPQLLARPAAPQMIDIGLAELLAAKT